MKAACDAARGRGSGELMFLDLQLHKVHRW